MAEEGALNVELFDGFTHCSMTNHENAQLQRRL